MKWVAVIVIWATGEWGVVDADTRARCQQLADQTAAQHKAVKEPCQQISTAKVAQMKAFKVRWIERGEWRPVYMCNRRGCADLER